MSAALLKMRTESRLRLDLFTQSPMKKLLRPGRSNFTWTTASRRAEV